MDLDAYLKNRAKQRPMRIALPEWRDERVLTAAAQLLAEGLAEVTLIGDVDAMRRIAREKDLDIGRAQFENPSDSPKREQFIEELYALRRHKGMTPSQAAELVAQPLYWAGLMVRTGSCDGYVAGAATATAEVVRCGLRVIGAAPGVKRVSAFTIMGLPRTEFGKDGVLFYADTGVLPSPSAEELAEIAVLTARSFKLIMQDTPRVAMLSYSSKGSAKGHLVDKVRQATALAQKAAPDLAIDGELQFDAAVIPWIAEKKVAESPVAGRANVLIFPNLDSGNIGYKMTERLADAVALGPVMQGMNAPINDLSRGCSAEDIVLLACLTSIRATA